MSKNRFFAVLLAMILLVGNMYAANPKREWRSTWLTTVWAIDWPSSRGVTASHQTAQKKEMTAYLDLLSEMKMTSVCFQVRSMCDAMYKSSCEPWSSYLTDDRGADPGWDPLEWVVEECHKRGMECYAWVNPYRYSTGAVWETAQDKQLESDGLILSYTTTNSEGKTVTTKILNPGLKASRDRIVNVCKEIIDNYRVDGILFDDYFYPNGIPTTSAAEDYTLWQSSGSSLTFANWRRANVNQMVKDVYDMIQANRPDVRFGISPAGVSGKYDLHGLTTKCPVGSDWQYNGIFSDPVAWLAEGTVDFISPQLYWKTTSSSNPFGKLTDWWSYAANAFNRHHYASMTLDSYETSNTSSLWAEHAKQITLSRQYTENNAPGSCFYSTKYLLRSASGLADYLIANNFSTPALSPEITWKSGSTYSAVSGLAYSGGTLSWNAVSNGKAIIRYTVYAVPNTVSQTAAQASNGDGINSKYLLGVSYANSYAIPAAQQGDYWYAVCVFDGYGKEHTAAVVNYNYTGGTSDVPEDESYDSEGTVSVEYLWSRTTANEGITFEENGSYNRAFCAVGDYVYIAGRDANSSSANIYLRKLNGETGETVGDIKLSSTGAVSLYPCNDVIKDESGNVCITNLTTNATTTPLKVFKVNLDNGELTEVASLTITKEIPAGTYRIDHAALLGDVAKGDFTVYAAVSSTASVVRWTFEGGVQTNEEVCTVSKFYPSTATSFGIAPRVVPVSSYSFFIDGASTAWSRYVFGSGTLLDSFDEGPALAPTSVGGNGGTYFTLNKKYYMTYSSADYSEGFKFNIASSTAKGMGFDTMSFMWTLPRNGMGTVNNNIAQANADYVQVNDATVRVYYYVPGNGICAYNIVDSAASGVESVAKNDLSVVVSGNTIKLSEVAQSLKVYNMMGAQVAYAANASEIGVNIPSGVYIVAATVNGVSHVKKVVVK